MVRVANSKPLRRLRGSTRATRNNGWPGQTLPPAIRALWDLADVGNDWSFSLCLRRPSLVVAPMLFLNIGGTKAIPDTEDSKTLPLCPNTRALSTCHGCVTKIYSILLVHSSVLSGLYRPNTSTTTQDRRCEKDRPHFSRTAREY